MVGVIIGSILQAAHGASLPPRRSVKPLRPCTNCAVIRSPSSVWLLTCAGGPLSASSRALIGLPGELFMRALKCEDSSPCAPNRCPQTHHSSIIPPKVDCQLCTSVWQAILGLPLSPC